MKAIIAINRKIASLIFFLFFSTLFISSCSSGGSGGKPGQPSTKFPNIDNPGSTSSSGSSSAGSSSSSSGSVVTEEEVAIAITELALNAIESYDGPQIDPPTEGIAASNVALLNSIPASASRTSETVKPGPCGGQIKTVTTVTMPDRLGVIFPYTTNSESTYSNYCSGNHLINGKFWLDGEYTSESSYTMTWSYDYTFTSKTTNDAHRYKYSQYCVTQNNNTTCEDGTWYRSTYGSSYRLHNSSVTKSSSNTYEISGSVVISDSRTNTYTLTAKNLSLCDNGRLGTGTIELTLNGSLYMRIEFTSCGEFTYYADGNSWVYSY